MLKKYLIISLIFVVLIIIMVIRLWSPEDTWLCQDGTWVKHGNPQQVAPATICTSSNPVNDNSRACTMEAKECPDGSAVGRTGPNCEFTLCPENNTKDGILPFDSGVEGVVTLGPVCPVMREGDTTCADKPYVTDIQVIAIGSPKSSPLATITSDQEGKYKIMLPPGEYALQPVSGAVFPRCETKNISIEPAKIIEANLTCDSGIR